MGSSISGVGKGRGVSPSDAESGTEWGGLNAGANGDGVPFAGGACHAGRQFARFLRLQPNAELGRLSGRQSSDLPDNDAGFAVVDSLVFHLDHAKPAGTVSTMVTFRCGVSVKFST